MYGNRNSLHSRKQFGSYHNTNRIKLTTLYTCWKKINTFKSTKFPDFWRYFLQYWTFVCLGRNSNPAMAITFFLKKWKAILHRVLISWATAHAVSNNVATIAYLSPYTIVCLFVNQNKSIKILFIFRLVLDFCPLSVNNCS